MLKIVWRGALAGELAGAFASYLRIAWWGLAAPRFARGRRLRVLQAVVIERSGEVLLSIRSDLRGWELPGGTPEFGETGKGALKREVLEETGLEVEVVRHVGDYRRSGFRPHTARVYLCRPVRGEIRPSRETRAVRWFRPDRLPSTLFPWYRKPLQDALQEHPEAVVRDEWQGLSRVLAGLAIDLRMRLSDDRAGLERVDGEDDSTKVGGNRSP